MPKFFLLVTKARGGGAFKVKKKCPLPLDFFNFYNIFIVVVHFIENRLDAYRFL